MLANVASRLIPTKNFSPNKVFMELIFRPSILDNIKKLQVFYEDQQIIQVYD